jgi:putative ABC transport system permease protein
MIKLLNISRIYTTHDVKTKALDDVSLTFPKRGLVCIVGPSGCGKTTLLNIIGGLDQPTSGTMVIDGIDTQKMRSKDWDIYRQNEVGFVFQQYNLLSSLTIEENVGMALGDCLKNPKEKRAKVRTILRQVHCEKEAKKHPNQLSGGQLQRIAIVRALVREPRIILADEPTGALDSKTAHDVMDLLKDASKNCLVVMVTHNEKLVTEFADGIITLSDGKVIQESVVIEEEKLVNNPKKKRSRMGLFSSLRLSLKQLYQKAIRTLLIVIAGSIGVMGVCLVLTISSGVQKYIIDIQRETLSDSPITIRSTTDNTDPDAVDDEHPQFPEDQIIYVVNRYASYYSHINIFSESFLNHLKNLNSDWVDIIDYKTVLDMKILTEMDDQIKKISNYKFMMMGEDEDYLSEQYDVLYGSLPDEAGELAILVDQSNCIDITVLNYLGIDYKDISSYTFEEITQKEYKVIRNNDYYYQKIDENYAVTPTSQYATLYENASNITLSISGILRLGKDAKTNIYDSGVLYTKALRDELLSDAHASDIGQAQLAYGLEKNVFTGQPFVDSESINGTITKEYLYEAQLGDLGLVDEISTIRIYTDRFDDRVAINEYLKEYNQNADEKDQILYYDYMGNFAREFDAFVEVLTKSLLIFALISLVVSSIMIGIITYISVVERMHDIGILRSLGASKTFVGMLFNVQNGFIGLLSGVIGLIGGALLMKPIVGVIVEVMERNDITTFDISSLRFSSFGIGYLLLLIALNIVLCMIAGLAPALMASSLKPVEAINKE